MCARELLLAETWENDLWKFIDKNFLSLCYFFRFSSSNSIILRDLLQAKYKIIGVTFWFRMSYCFVFRSFILFLFSPFYYYYYYYFSSVVQMIPSRMALALIWETMANTKLHHWLVQKYLWVHRKKKKRAEQMKKQNVCFIAFLSLFSNRISIVACKMCVFHFSNKHNFVFVRVYVIWLLEIVTLTICDQQNEWKKNERFSFLHRFFFIFHSPYGTNGHRQSANWRAWNVL